MYYPSSQIKTNLYTNGQEYTLKSNGENYIGSYWKTSSGKYYTGKSPEDKNTQELIVVTKSQTSNLTQEAFNSVSSLHLNNSDVIAEEYSKLNTRLSNIKKTPINYNPIPNQNDYKLGEFTRFFCKKTNEIRYIEIDKDTYEKLLNQEETYLWQLYIPFKYQWIIFGDKESTYLTNKNVTNYMIQKYNFPLFNKFLKEDYLKFFK